MASDVRLKASVADLDEFRKNVTLVRKRIADQYRKKLVTISTSVGNTTSIPWRVDLIIRKLWRHGPAVAKYHKIGVFRQFIQMIDDFFRFGFYPDDFYFYQFYLAERRKQRSKYFMWVSHLLPVLTYLADCANSADFALLGNKSRFVRRCMELGLPTVPLLADFADGKMIPGICKHEAEIPAADLFSKPHTSYGGIGATWWRFDGVGSFIDSVTSKSYDKKSLVKRLQEDSRFRPLVLQKKVSNHSAFQLLTNGALSTVRIMTCRSPQGSIDLLPPIIRMPNGKGFVDNLDGGGLAAPIELATGKICGPAIQEETALCIKWVDKHPDTGASFIGMALPFWDQTIELSKRAHMMFPSIHFIGWDIAILEDGPVLIEANTLASPELIEMPHGISLSDTQFILYCNYYVRQALNAEPPGALT